MKIYFTFLLLLISSLAHADFDADFQSLKNSGRNFEPTGAICEEVARLRLSEKYPEPHHTVVTGIQYDDETGTLGELDLVVFKNETKLAQIIAEVKCWRSAKSGFKKAKEQRKRFLDHVKSPKALVFKWTHDPTIELKKIQFKKPERFYFIAQSGSSKHGFDIELPYTVDELMQLRDKLIECQNQGQCLKPN